ncbi:hypothetical protein ACQ4PT_030425 [Festuca glaucescens]
MSNAGLELNAWRVRTWDESSRSAKHASRPRFGNGTRARLEPAAFPFLASFLPYKNSPRPRPRPHPAAPPTTAPAANQILASRPRAVPDPLALPSAPTPVTAAMSSSPLLSDEGVSRVRRKKDFSHMDRVDGHAVNILQGLELHTAVFSPEEQRAIVAAVLDLQDRGRRGLLRERTYSEPRKWMRGKGRATIQFGCCYNYATDRDGNPPGIVRDSAVDPLPPLLAAMVRRLVLWRVLPRACVPDSCIVNVYDVGDCIPPHVDSHDFLRPFCTASFLAHCDILFGRSLRVLGPGEFGGAGSTPINLPAGSVLVLGGNGADVAKHCVPAVPAKRISITFRKMDAAKVPFGFTPHAMLQNLSAAAPPAVRPAMASRPPHPHPPHNTGGQSPGGVPFSLSTDEFPSLGASPLAVRPAMASTPLYRPQNTGAADQHSQSAAARTATPKQQQAATQNKNQAALVTAGQSPGGVRFGLSTDEFPVLGALPAGKEIDKTFLFFER